MGRDVRRLFVNTAQCTRPVMAVTIPLTQRPKHANTHCIAPRVENGTGKFRPDRLRLPFKPTVNRFREKKIWKWENKTGKRTGTGTVGVFSRPFSRFPFSAGKIPAGIPVFVVVGCVTCVGNVNCCLHVFQRELWIRDSLYLCFLVIRVLFPCYLCIFVTILSS